MRDQRALLVVAGVVLLVAAWLSVPADSGRTLDPRSTGEAGFAAGVLLLEESGVDVVIDHEPGDGPVLVTRPSLDDEQVDALAAHVREGGRAIVFDPSLEIASVDVLGQLNTSVFGPTDATPGCAPLAGYVERVESPAWLILDPAADTTNCLSVGAGVGLVYKDVGEGEIIVMGAPVAWTNDHIDAADNARLLAAVVLEDEPATVVVLDEARPGSVEEPQGFFDLVTERFWVPFWLLVVAFGLWAWHRGRRMERPVEERLPVRVPGSELVLAIGDLLQRHGHHQAAADRLRADLGADLRRALRLPQETEDTVVQDALRTRYPDLRPGDVDLAVSRSPVGSTDALMRLGEAVARVRDVTAAVSAPAPTVTVPDDTRSEELP